MSDAFANAGVEILRYGRPSGGVGFGGCRLVTRKNMSRLGPKGIGKYEDGASGKAKAGRPTTGRR